MKHFSIALRPIAAFAVALSVAGCGSAAQPSSTAQPSYDKDFSELPSPIFQEGAYDYQYFPLPSDASGLQAYAGDPMPYYEDGTYYLYYLKDGGDSFNHSIYLTTTTDFVTFADHEGPILEATAGAQDEWVGTGSVVKVGETYYLFYTGHVDNPAFEYQEKILVAKGTSPTSFEKVADWELTPPDELGQKRDFRDPQAYYDPERDVIDVTVTAAQSGVARVVKFTLAPDLSEATYDGIILSDPIEAFWNLECSDTFKLGDRYYITYSAQDDTLWYASSPEHYGPYDEPRRIDGKLFYAAKHVESEDGCYMVGWLRRSESPASTDEVSAWGGNLAVQQVGHNEDGSLYLCPVDAVAKTFVDRRELLAKGEKVSLDGSSGPNSTEAFTAYERFLITGDFTFEGVGSFGLSFDYDGDDASRKLVAIDAGNDSLTLSFNGGATHIADTVVALEPGKTYSFSYLQEGSCGVLYVDGVASLAVRLYGVSGKPISLFADGCAVEFANLRQYTAPPA